MKEKRVGLRGEGKPASLFVSSAKGEDRRQTPLTQQIRADRLENKFFKRKEGKKKKTSEKKRGKNKTEKISALQLSFIKFQTKAFKTKTVFPFLKARRTLIRRTEFQPTRKKNSVFLHSISLLFLFQKIRSFSSTFDRPLLPKPPQGRSFLLCQLPPSSSGAG